MIMPGRMGIWMLRLRSFSGPCPLLTSCRAALLLLFAASAPSPVRYLNSSRENQRVFSSFSFSAPNPSMAKPPVAKKVKHEMDMFGDVRVDNYYWLRDDSRTDPEVLAYLKEENAYTELFMSGKSLGSRSRCWCVSIFFLSHWSWSGSLRNWKSGFFEHSLNMQWSPRQNHGRSRANCDGSGKTNNKKRIFFPDLKKQKTTF